MNQMTIGSLFDGSGGFPLAGALCGIRPLWASEIEAYPLKVTAARLPHVTQLGDVTNVGGADIEPVDIISFGSPCQDLSTAGKQAGIHKGARSSLFFQAIRIIKEMREANKKNGRSDVNVRPRYAVWENVPGAFSSGGGSDFNAVIEALANIAEDGVSIPRPSRSEWLNAGCVVGNGWSIAWRQYDSQYWGIPQRRKRIYLVADFGSERAGEILFERESLRGHPDEGEATQEGIADHVEGGTGGGCGIESIGFAWANSAEAGLGDISEGVPPIKATRNGIPGVAFTNTEKDTSYVIEGNMVDRATNQNGRGYMNGICPTLNTQDRHAVVAVYPEKARSLCARHDSSPCVDQGQNVICYDARGNGDGKVVPTLTGEHQSRVTDYTALCVGNGQMANITMAPISNTLDCMHDQQAVLMKGKSPRKYIVRRLTPLECCRLQGFPDWWEDGVDGSDSARYKMWGNGIALPCAYDVLERIARQTYADTEEMEAYRRNEFMRILRTVGTPD